MNITTTPASDPVLKVGTSLPLDIFADSHEARAADLQAIVDAGLDHIVIADHVSFRGGHGIDGLTYLAALSGIEPRLDLYLGVMLLALRHPVVAARQITQLAMAAPGRLTLGVGVGGEDRHEFEVCGVDPKTRGRRTDAALTIVRSLLAGEKVDFDDEFFTLEQAEIKPTVAPVPITIGGRSDAALARAGAMGDGWLASWCSARRFAEGIDRCQQIAADADRAPHWRHGLQIWIGVGPTHEEARTHVAAGMEAFYRIPFAGFEPYTPSGTAADVAEFLLPYVQAGATDLNLTACGPDRTHEIETLGEIKRLLQAEVASTPSPVLDREMQ